MGILWNRSGTIERYGDDLRASGAKAYFFQGGTTTPLVVFQDGLESIAHPIPLLADANGRWPDVFIPYTVSFDVRVTSAFDAQLTFTQQVPNPNPVDTTVIVPPQNQVQTGMIHGEFISVPKVGYVRLNGLTVGNATSSATERANPDTSALFTYLWTNLTDTLAPVSGGRGGSAAADFSANKTIRLPDMRGSALRGLADMGNADSGAYSGLTFDLGNATSPGSQTGNNSRALAIANLPAHAHTGTTSAAGGFGALSVSASGGGVTGGNSTGISLSFDPGHSHSISYTTAATTNGAGAAFGYVDSVGLGGANTGNTGIGGAHTHSVSDPTHAHSFGVTVSGATSGQPDHVHTFTSSSVGSGTAFNNMGFSKLVTWFIKL